MPRHRYRTIVLAALALLSGCGALDRISAPSLEGSPETTGIVVIEPDITFYAPTLGTPYGVRLISGALARVDDPKQVLRSRAVSGLVVFSNFAPGKWQLVLIEGELPPGHMLPDEYTRWRRHYEVPTANSDSFTFDVRAGEVVYAGAAIADDARAESRGIRFARHDDTAAERSAWSRMEELYPNSAWAPVFHAAR